MWGEVRLNFDVGLHSGPTGGEGAGLQGTSRAGGGEGYHHAKQGIHIWIFTLQKCLFADMLYIFECIQLFNSFLLISKKKILLI